MILEEYTIDNIDKETLERLLMLGVVAKLGYIIIQTSGQFKIRNRFRLKISKAIFFFSKNISVHDSFIIPLYNSKK